MQYRRSWNDRIPARAGRDISMQAATRSFIEAGSSLCTRTDYLAKDRIACGALPLKTVYDLIAKIYPESDSVYDLPAIDKMTAK
jgi:hypothetical protein